MKDIHERSSAAAAKRAPYATQACDVCRRKKTKCDEQKPVCRKCIASNRQDECAWTGEPVRHPRTEAHYEAMRRRIVALEEHCAQLKTMVEQCRQEHGGTDLANRNDTLEFHPTNDYEFDEDEDEDEELIVSTQNLKESRPSYFPRLEERGLVFYGTAAPFRFAASPSQPTRRLSDIMDDSGARYVLWIPSSNPSTPPSDVVNPTFDWSRYLPPGPLTRREHDQILDLLFRFFTSWCLRVVPTLFLRDMYRYISATHVKTPHYSPMLHNALIALATAFSDDPIISGWENRVMYASRAKAYKDEECKKPNICVVQALSLLGSFHSSNGDQNLGYLYFGMSTNISQILGLGVDCSRLVKAGQISRDDMLDRNWAYWTTFSLDVCWSLYVGRDCSVPIPAHAGDIPVPFVDSELDRIQFYHPTANIPSQESHLSKTFAATCALSVVARRVMGIVNSYGSGAGGRGEVVNDELLSRMDMQLNDWKSSLSPEMDLNHQTRLTATPHRLMMHLLYELMFILLHRPFFHRRQQHAGRPIDHRRICKRSAEHIMSILETWQRLYTLRYVPVTLFQAVFSAGTVFLLFHRQSNRAFTGAHGRTRSGSDSAPSSATSTLIGSLNRSRSGARSFYIVQVELCIRYLNEIGRSWRSARNIAGILAKLLEDQVGPSSSSSSKTSPPAKEVRYSPPPGPPPGYVDAFLNSHAADAMHMDLGIGFGAGSFDSDYQQIQLEDMLRELYPSQQQQLPTYLSGSPQRMLPPTLFQEAADMEGVYLSTLNGYDLTPSASA